MEHLIKVHAKIQPRCVALRALRTHSSEMRPVLSNSSGTHFLLFHEEINSACKTKLSAVIKRSSPNLASNVKQISAT